MAYQKMPDLLKKQEDERKDLAAGVYEAWKSIGENEQEMLADYEGEYENAPPEIQEQIAQARQAFFTEWGSDGRLAALMEARHVTERENLAAHEQQIEKINQRLRTSENDRDR